MKKYLPIFALSAFSTLEASSNHSGGEVGDVIIDLSLILGRGCSTAVEHSPCDSEVEGLIPAGCWAFSFSFSFSSSFLSFLIFPS